MHIRTGLKTNIGLVDTWQAWGCVVLVIVSVVFAKTTCCGLAAWYANPCVRVSVCSALRCASLMYNPPCVRVDDGNGWAHFFEVGNDSFLCMGVMSVWGTL